MNMPTLFSDDRLVFGCDRLIVASTDGQVLETESFVARESPPGKTVVSREGRYIALSLDTRRVVRHLLAESDVIVANTRIAIHDMVLKKVVLSLGIDPLPEDDFDFALSFDGSKLAVLNDRHVSIYSVPVGIP
jgi:hypothetical protein